MCRSSATSLPSERFTSLEAEATGCNKLAKILILPLIISASVLAIKGKS